MNQCQNFLVNFWSWTVSGIRVAHNPFLLCSSWLHIFSNIPPEFENVNEPEEEEDDEKEKELELLLQRFPAGSWFCFWPNELEQEVWVPVELSPLLLVDQLLLLNILITLWDVKGSYIWFSKLSCFMMLIRA